MGYPRRINIAAPHIWRHHQRGWKYVIELLRTHFHSPGGVRFLSSVDDTMADGLILREPWVGFLHQVPDTHGRWFPDLKRIFASAAWQENLPGCRGIFVLSEYIAKFIRASVDGVPVSRVPYAAAPAAVRFDGDAFLGRQPRRMVMIGQYLRNFQAYYDLPAPGYRKILLRHHGVDLKNVRTNDSVTVEESLSPSGYDRIFKDSLVFLNLKDAAANTTIIECIAADTPVLVNPVGGIREYLGDGYPLYYRDLEEAFRKAADGDLIVSASQYIKRSPAKKLTGKAHFLKSFSDSEVYTRIAERAT